MAMLFMIAGPVVYASEGSSGSCFRIGHKDQSANQLLFLPMTVRTNCECSGSHFTLHQKESNIRLVVVNSLILSNSLESHQESKKRILKKKKKNIVCKKNLPSKRVLTKNMIRKWIPKRILNIHFFQRLKRVEAQLFISFT